MKNIGLVVLLTGCSGTNGGTTSDTEVLRLNHVQAKGTHNSYHVEPPEVLDPSFGYTHAPLDVQLSEQGVRQFELDVHLRQDEGFEVFHIPLIDEETTCRKLVDCLGVVKAWSDQNPSHMPIMIWLEPKDEDADFLDDTLVPIFGHYDELEAEILSVFPAERILTPDDVRKDYATLPEAIAAEGWPTLGALREKVLFSMLDSENHRAAYTRDAPALEGRLLFVDADQASDPYAALFKINDAQSDGEEVQTLVAAGFIVTSNVDGVTQEDAANTARAEASLQAGVHYSSSDFPAPVSDRDYWFDIPEGNPARCNPVYGSDPCSPNDIENLP